MEEMVVHDRLPRNQVGNFVCTAPHSHSAAGFREKGGNDSVLEFFPFYLYNVVSLLILVIGAVR